MANEAYKDSPSAPVRSSVSSKNDDHSIDDCHMPEANVSNRRKRQRSEQRPHGVIGALQSLAKRRKTSHPTTISSHPPAAFWDNLSKIWLTKGALRELERRTAQSAPSPPHLPYRQPHRPLTRHALTRAKDTLRTAPAIEILHHYTPGRLHDIKLFARHGGPDLSDLKGYPEPIDPLLCMMSSSQSTSRGRKRGSTSTSNTKTTKKTTTTRSTGPYDRGFQQNLIDGGIYPDEYAFPDGRVPAQPENWEEISRKLREARPSLSPSQFSDGQFRNFKRENAHAFKEQQIMTTVIPIITGKITDTGCVSGGIPFTNLDHLTDGTLVPGNPDIYDGARPEQLHRRVRNELKGDIVPSTQDNLPIVPNFFLAAKGPDGTGAIAGRQACYDGALGARGLHSLQSYGRDEPVYNGDAYTITSTYNDGQLKMYTSHPAQPAEGTGRPEYHMTQINAWSLTGNPASFRQGATAFRNARDWAKEKRNEAITRANEIAKSTYSEASVAILAESTVIPSTPQSSVSTEGASSLGEIVQQESETSIDELALELNAPAKRSLKSHYIRGRKRVSRARSSATATARQVSNGSGQISRSDGSS